MWNYVQTVSLLVSLLRCGSPDLDRLAYADALVTFRRMTILTPVRLRESSRPYDNTSCHLMKFVGYPRNDVFLDKDTFPATVTNLQSGTD